MGGCASISRLWTHLGASSSTIWDIGGVVAARGGTRSWRRRQGSCSRVVRRGCIVLWSTQRSPRVFATMGKTHLILGYPGEHIYGFGLLWAHNHRGFRPPPWAKITWVWATKDKKLPLFGLPLGKFYLGLGYYGHRTPRGLGPRAKITWAWAILGFGPPWANFSWGWAIMGTEPPRVRATVTARPLRLISYDEGDVAACKRNRCQAMRRAS